jgi:hypothetical protein
MSQHEAWVESCLAGASAAFAETGYSVTPKVVEKLAELLAADLQMDLKPADIRQLVVDIASLNSGKS